MDIQTFPTIYKRDSKGKIREWRMEVEGSKHRTVAGLQNGKQVTSSWTECDSKNVGKANETTPEQQAVLEVEAQYKKKTDGEYHKDLSNVDKPKWFKPMLAATWEKRQEKIKYPAYFQPKLDGIRCIADKDGLWTRSGKEIVAVPHIHEELQHLFEQNPELILDGELYNHELKEDFNKIVSLVRKTKPKPEDVEEAKQVIQYHVYDLPNSDKFSKRWEDLSSLVAESETIRIVKTDLCESEEDVDEAYSIACSLGYEGGIVRLDAEYQQKRSNNLVKRKDFDDDEFEILEVLEGKGNWNGCAKMIRIKTPSGECEATIQGSMDYCRHVLENSENYIGKKATVVFFGYTTDGALRFPIAKVLHQDNRW